MAIGIESTAKVEEYKKTLRDARRHIIEFNKMRGLSDEDNLLSVKYIDDVLPPPPDLRIATYMDLAFVSYDAFVGKAQPMTTAPQDGRWIEILSGTDLAWHRVRWDGQQWATGAKDGILAYMQPHAWKAT